MKSKQQRQKEAAERAVERTAAEQLQRLDAQFGKGKGAKRERAKLLKALLAR